MDSSTIRSGVSTYLTSTQQPYRYAPTAPKQVASGAMMSWGSMEGQEPGSPEGN